eukprot:gene6052-12204_t
MSTGSGLTSLGYRVQNIDKEDCQKNDVIDNILSTEPDGDETIREAVLPILSAALRGVLKVGDPDLIELSLDHASEKAAKLYDGCIKDVTLDDVAAVVLFTFSSNSLEASFSSLINGALLSKDTTALKPFKEAIQVLVRAFHRCPSPSTPMIYRGSHKNLHPLYPENTYVMWSQFASCVTSIDNLEKPTVVGPKRRTIFHIKPSVMASKARDVSKVIQSKKIDEIIITPGCCFLIEKNIVEDDVVNIFLAEVSSEGALPFVLEVDTSIDTDIEVNNDNNSNNNNIDMNSNNISSPKKRLSTNNNTNNNISIRNMNSTDDNTSTSTPTTTTTTTTTATMDEQQAMDVSQSSDIEFIMPAFPLELSIDEFEDKHTSSTSTSTSTKIHIKKNKDQNRSPEAIIKSMKDITDRDNSNFYDNSNNNTTTNDNIDQSRQQYNKLRMEEMMTRPDTTTTNNIRVEVEVEVEESIRNAMSPDASPDGRALHKTISESTSDLVSLSMSMAQQGSEVGSDMGSDMGLLQGMMSPAPIRDIPVQSQSQNQESTSDELDSSIMKIHRPYRAMLDVILHTPIPTTVIAQAAEDRNLSLLMTIFLEDTDDHKIEAAGAILNFIQGKSIENDHNKVLICEQGGLLSYVEFFTKDDVRSNDIALLAIWLLSTCTHAMSYFNMKCVTILIDVIKSSTSSSTSICNVLLALEEVTREDDKCCTLLASAGAVTLLLDMLTTSSTSTSNNTSKNISTSSSSSIILVNRFSQLKDKIIKILCYICRNDSAKTKLVCAGGVTILMGILKKNTPLPLMEGAINIICNLSSKEGYHKLLISAAELIIDVLHKGTALSVQYSISLVYNLISYTTIPDNKKIFLKAMILHDFIHLIRYLNMLTKEVAIRTIIKLIFKSDNKYIDLKPWTRRQYVKEIISWLQIDNDVIISCAAKILGKMLKDEKISKNNKLFPIITSGINILLTNMTSESAVVRDNTSKALSEISINPEYVIIMIEGNCVPIIFQTMDMSSSKTVELLCMKLLHNVMRSVRTGATVMFIPFISKLVSMLSTGSDKSIECACSILYMLSIDVDIRIAMVEADGISSIISLLSVGTEAMKNSCVGTLSYLLEIETYQHAIAEFDMVASSVIPLLSSDVISVQNDALLVLLQLSFVDTVRDAIIEHEALPRLLSLLESSTSAIVENSMKLLVKLLDKDSSIRDIIVSKGAHKRIMRLLHKDTNICVAASMALWSISRNPPLNQQLIDAGGIKESARLLRKGPVSSREGAAVLIANMTACDPNIRSAIVESGAVPDLVLLLATNPLLAVKEKVLAALKQLSGNINACVSMVEAGVIYQLVHLLDSGSMAAYERCTGTLANLAYEPQNRRLMVDAGLFKRIFLVLDKANIVTIERITAILKCFSIEQEYCDLIASEYDIFKLLKFIPEGSEYTKEYIAEIISNILSNDIYYSTIESNIEFFKLFISIIYHTHYEEDIGYSPLAHDFESNEYQKNNTHAQSRAPEYTLECILSLLYNDFNHNILFETNLMSALIISFEKGTSTSKIRSAMIIGQLAIMDLSTSETNKLLSPEILKSICNQLKKGSKLVVEACISTLRALSINSDCHDYLLSAWAVEALQYTLRNGSHLAVEDTAGVICNVCRDENNDVISSRLSIISSSEIITVLLRALTDYSTEVSKECVSEAIFFLSSEEQYRTLLLDTGAASAMILSLQKEGDEDTVDCIINALCNLIQSSKEINEFNGEHIRQTSVNGTSAVISLLTTTEISFVIERAVIVLYKVVECDHADIFITIKFGVVRTLVRILATGTRTAQAYTSGILAKIAEYSKEGRDAIMAVEGLLETVINVFTDGTKQAQSHACVLIQMLAEDEGYRNPIAASGILPLLVDMLSDVNSVETQTAAAGALYSLSRKTNKKEIGESGAIPPLVHLFRTGRNSNVKENSRLALQKLAKDSQNREEMKSLGVTKDGIGFVGMFW